MRGIKLNMMHKIKNARHKINMTRKKKKKKEEEGGAVRKRGGESRNQKKRRRREKRRWARDESNGPEGENRTSLVQGKKTEPVQPLYKGLGPVFSFLKALSLSSSFFSLLFPPF